MIEYDPTTDEVKAYLFGDREKVREVMDLLKHPGTVRIEGDSQTLQDFAKSNLDNLKAEILKREQNRGR